MTTVINQRLFTTRKPIAELVAAAIARAELATVRLYTLLIWVRKNVQRIVSRMLIRELAKTAAKSIITTVPITSTVKATVPQQISVQDGLKALAAKAKTAAQTAVISPDQRERSLSLSNSKSTVNSARGAI